MIVGATGTGKTKLSIDAAVALGGEVVNADKIQLYEETFPIPFISLSLPSLSFVIDPLPVSEPPLLLPALFLILFISCFCNAARSGAGLSFPSGEAVVGGRVTHAR